MLGAAVRRWRGRGAVCLWRLLAVCCLVSSAFAQYRFDSWTADTGLPQNIIRAIHQTPDGYLWIATLDGLARFDGVRFTVFNRSNSPGIKGNRFTTLYEDLLQIATLQWYAANTTTSFYIGNPTASAIIFDGANMWVADVNSNVRKLRTNDGLIIDKFGTDPSVQKMAFDGANIWTVSITDNSVRKIRASDGETLGTFDVGLSSPIGITFDGANIWVTNSGTNSVTKLRASDGSNPENFSVGNNPSGIAFDGANIWIVNQGDNTVTKLRASDGANLGTFRTGDGPTGIAFDGAHIWVVAFNGTVSKF